MNPVAIVGFGDTKEAAYNLPDDVELWTVNHAHFSQGFPRIDRLFEMHPYTHIVDHNYLREDFRDAHIEFLRTNRTIPVYMLERCAEFPASVRYPIEQVMALTAFSKLTSSFCYMVALAILENRPRIEIYGIDLLKGEEWEYQREDALFWIGQAEGRGIKVVGDGKILDDKIMYGYVGMPMVTNATIETNIKWYQDQLGDSIAKMNQWKGVYIERTKRNGDGDPDEIQEAANNLRMFEHQVAMGQGAVSALENLLETCALRDVDPVLEVE
jgi:hypothetical protein